MVPGAIFISHRSEYADLVKALKAAIQETAQGQIGVFISETSEKVMIGGRNSKKVCRSRKSFSYLRCPIRGLVLVFL